MILKRFSYNLENTGDTKQTPPFYIDMSLLFEQYVYALLLKNNDVEYQVKHTDFLIDDITIDSKYKTKYKNTHVNDDIAQLARYGRNKAIRKVLNLDEKIAKCLIIYPNRIGEEFLDRDLWQQAEGIKAFKAFKKIAIKLPSFDA